MSWFQLFPQSNTAVGLSFESESLRASEIGVVRGEVQCADVAEVLLPEGAITNGVITNRIVVTQALKQLWKQGRFRSRNVVFTVDGASITEKDLLDPDQRDGSVNALAIQAASETLIDARLNPIATEAIASALVRAGLPMSAPDSVAAAVELGSDVVTVAIFDSSGELLFTRGFANAGTDIAAMTIQSAFGITFQEARQRMHGLDGHEFPIEDWQRRTAEILHTWSIASAKLAADSFEQFRREHPTSTITSLVLSGNGSTLNGTSQEFKNQLNLEVHCLDQAALTTSLARNPHLPEIATRPNLLPQVVREAVVLLRMKRWVIAAFIVLGVVSLAAWTYQQPQLNDLNEQLQLLRGGHL